MSITLHETGTWHYTASSAMLPVAGQMKDILTTALGMMLFGDANTSGQALVGIGAGLLGGMAYSYFSYCDISREPHTKKVTALVALAQNLLTGCKMLIQDAGVLNNSTGQAERPIRQILPECVGCLVCLLRCECHLHYCSCQPHFHAFIVAFDYP